MYRLELICVSLFFKGQSDFKVHYPVATKVNYDPVCL